MKKISFAFFIALLLCLSVGFSACSGNNNQNQTESDSPNSTSDGNMSSDAAGGVLVAYFSRTGENYGVGNIPSGGYAGYIEKGNTEIVAEIIAEVTGGDLFEIVPVVSYPDSYSEMLSVAQKERDTDARPAIQSAVPNFESYDVIFLGYPIWNGNCPNIMLTFMESYDFTGKTVIPLCTHAGSGLGSSMNTIRTKLSSATVINGLAIPGTTAQNDRNAARSQVESFIEGSNTANGSPSTIRTNKG